MTEVDGLDRVFAQAEALKRKYAGRDSRATQVRHIRNGDFDKVAPEIFNDEWPRPVVANLIDVLARDYAAALAPLPSFSCSATSMMSESARKFADRRTKIANSYLLHSNLAAQNLDGADGYGCYGLYAIMVKPDLDAKMPFMRVLDGASVYPLWDSQMRTRAALIRTFVSAPDLEVEYPELRELRKKTPGSCTEERYELCQWVDDKRVVAWLPAMKNHVLKSSPNPIGKCFVVAVPRPSGEGSWTGNIHGAYDDLIWPQMMRHNLSILSVQAADKAINAPLVVPMDVADIPEGPDAILRTSNTQGVRRADINVPPQAFAAMDWLERDILQGAMTNQGRLGQQGSGWTTGRGMEALGDGFNSGVAAAQEMLKFALREAVCLSFRWDETLWRNETKKIRGQDNGVPFEMSYMPAKDINGDYTVEVTYGFMTGMDPNRALVYVLQMLGAGVVSKDYVARSLPAQINATEELKKVDLEQVRAATVAALGGVAASLPQMIANGMDPSAIVTAIAKVAQEMQKGRPIEQVVVDVFAPPKPEPTAAAVDPSAPPAPPEGGLLPPPPGGGGRPSLQMLMAGLSSSGSPQLGASVSRMPEAVQ